MSYGMSDADVFLHQTQIQHCTFTHAGFDVPVTYLHYQHRDWQLSN